MHFKLISSQNEKVDFNLKWCFANECRSHSRIFHNFQKSNAFLVTIMLNILNCLLPFDIDSITLVQISLTLDVSS